jgi:phosphatidate cytidylyltransferase
MTQTVSGHPFVRRAVTTVVLLPTVLFLTWAEGWHLGFSLFVSGLAAVGIYEYYAIVRARAISPETIGGILSGTLVVFSGYMGDPTIVNLMLYGGCLMVSTLHIVRGQRSVAGLASSVFGVFYVGWFGAHVTLLHSNPLAGAGWVTVLVLSVMITDSAAYLVGSLAGRHKMAPSISPKKTWEGALGGVAGGLGCMAALYYLHSGWGERLLPDWSLTRYLCVGVVLTLSGQIGDLVESALKRDAGVKDSGSVFPGHGGVLDRCDSVLFAAPVLYYVVTPPFGISI